MAAAAYLRVSTGGQTVKAQRAAVERAARARGDRIDRRGWFSETASRGQPGPALAALRAAVRAGRFDRVYVFRLDRLGEGIARIFELVAELRRGGAELVTLADPFSLDGPAGELGLAILAWSAEQERRTLRARLAAARARVEAEGGRWGRPRRLGPTDVARARELLKTRTLRQVAVALKVPRSTLADAISRSARRSPDHSRRASSRRL